jgi:hypothetical protein
LVFENPSIESASISDPYVLLLMTDGTLRLLTFKQSGGKESLNMVIPKLSESSNSVVTAICLYRSERPFFIGTTDTGS